MTRPQGSFEWGALVTATAVVAAIALFYAEPWERAAEERVQPVPARVKGAVAVRPARPRTQPSPPEPQRPAFTLRASGGDSWLSVRARSYDGRVIYEGVLLDGREVKLRSSPLWIRFGAAAHVTLTIDGRPVRLPAFGTYDAFLAAAGVRQDRTPYATAAQSP